MRARRMPLTPLFDPTRVRQPHTAERLTMAGSSGALVEAARLEDLWVFGMDMRGERRVVALRELRLAAALAAHASSWFLS